MRPSLRLLLVCLCPLASLLQAAEVEVVKLKDGRVLTGKYDPDAGTITITGPASATIKVAKDDVISVTETKADPAATSEPTRKHEADPLAAFDQQIAQKTREKDEADANAKEYTSRAREETDAATRATSPSSQKIATERSQRFTQTATKYQSTSARLSTELSDLKSKRDELARKQDELTKQRTSAEESSKKAVDGVTSLVDTLQKDDGKKDASPYDRYQRLEAEDKELETKITQLNAVLKEHTDALAKLKTQLDQDMALIKTLDLGDLTWTDTPGESAAAKEQRLSDFKAYNFTMASLRNAKTDYLAGTRPNYEAAFALLHQDVQRKLYQQKTGKPLVFPDSGDARK